MKILEARHGMESAWISCNLKPRLNNLDNVIVTFKPINKKDVTKRLRIFAHRIKDSPKINVSIENLGDLKIDLNMETFCWDRDVNDVQSIGKSKFCLEPNHSGSLAIFKLDDIKLKCGGYKSGIDFRIHFRPEM